MTGPVRFAKWSTRRAGYVEKHVAAGGQPLEMYRAARKRGIAVKVDQGIAEFLDYVEMEKGLAPLTVKVYRHYLGRFRGVAGGEPPGGGGGGDRPGHGEEVPSAPGAPDGARWPAHLKKVTQGYHIVALRAFLRYLIVQRGVEYPGAGEDRPAQGEPAEGVVPESGAGAEAARLPGHLDGHRPARQGDPGDPVQHRA